MKTAVVFYSKHHHNTEKLLKAIKANSKDDITLIDVTEVDSASLDDYDAVGFASGIYYSKFEKRVLEFAKNYLPSGKNVFFIYTSGSKNKDYSKSIREAIQDKNANILGEYGCRGYDTYGPFKLIGGISKNHPNEEEINGAVDFYNSLNQ